ncbi:hypothetical protein Bhyg_05716, partial [Pseudolycoriella hygida]
MPATLKTDDEDRGDRVGGVDRERKSSRSHNQDRCEKCKLSKTGDCKTIDNDEALRRRNELSRNMSSGCKSTKPVVLPASQRPNVTSMSSGCKSTKSLVPPAKQRPNVTSMSSDCKSTKPVVLAATQRQSVITANPWVTGSSSGGVNVGDRSTNSDNKSFRIGNESSEYRQTSSGDNRLRIESSGRGQSFGGGDSRLRTYSASARPSGEVNRPDYSPGCAIL